jgi:hypothetical protein
MRDLRVNVMRALCPFPNLSARPQDNAYDEQIDRIISAECGHPPHANRWAKQPRFVRWRMDLNGQLPHAPLGMRVPGEVYQNSAKRGARHRVAV